MRPLQSDDPSRVADYRLVARLGAGGMGQVFLARSPGGRTVAIKMIRAELADQRGFRARFRREVAAARRVSGPYTAAVVDADPDAATPWLATAYVAGPSLGDAVATYGPLPEPTVRALAAGLAEALEAVHAADLVHRDLKPTNVLLALDGPRLIDFGISRAADDTTITGTGHVVGSPGYMSPEQANGLEIGPPSDLFSLASVLVFAATGRGPFGTGSTPSLLYRIVHNDPDLSNAPAYLPPILAGFLDKDARSRPPARELMRRAVADGGTTEVLTRTGWLPAAVTYAMAQHSAELLDLDTTGASETAWDAVPPAAAEGGASGVPGVIPPVFGAEARRGAAADAWPGASDPSAPAPSERARSGAPDAVPPAAAADAGPGAADAVSPSPAKSPGGPPPPPSYAPTVSGPGRTPQGAPVAGWPQPTGVPVESGEPGAGEIPGGSGGSVGAGSAAGHETPAAWSTGVVPGASAAPGPYGPPSGPPSGPVPAPIPGPPSGPPSSYGPPPPPPHAQRTHYGSPMPPPGAALPYGTPYEVPVGEPLLPPGRDVPAARTLGRRGFLVGGVAASLAAGGGVTAWLLAGSDGDGRDTAAGSDAPRSGDSGNPSGPNDSGRGVAPGGRSSGPTYTLGLQGPLSGENAQIGLAVKNGVDIAVTEANETGGNPFLIKLSAVDDQGTTAQAPVAARRLADDSTVVAVIGPVFSSAARAASDTYSAARLPAISPSATHISLTGSDNTWFTRAVPHDIASGKEIGGYIADKLRASAAYLVDDGSEYGAGVVAAAKDELAKAGVQVTTGTVRTGDDPTAVATAIRDARAPAVLFGGIYTVALPFARKLKDVGYSGTCVGSDGVFSPTFVADPAAEGWHVTASGVDATAVPELGAFASTYRSRHRSDPPQYAAESYDVANLVIEVVKSLVRAGKPVSRAELLTGIRAGDYRGLTKDFSFDERTGEFTGQGISVSEVRGGGTVYLGRIKDLIGG